MRPPADNNQNSSRSNPSKNDDIFSVANLTQERPTESNAIQIPKIELPKGGGALKGIDEKFEVNAANGTASLSVPLRITPGRNGFNPDLSINYSSGGGNSTFGLGWSLGLPSIQIKTDKQLPSYGAYEKEDIYMFSGVEDLVPYLKKDDNDNWIPVDRTAGGYEIERYRPRIEGAHSKIEKISKNGKVWWRVVTRENVTTYFGTTAESRIFDLQSSDRIFKWLPTFQHDDKGNILKYTYKKEDLAGVQNHLHEAHRLVDAQKVTNTYLKSVEYGNKKAWYINESVPFDEPDYNKGFFFKLILDYGEHNDALQPLAETDTWSVREDPFSNYKPGFEIRTYRLCRRALMLHSFKDANRYLNDNSTKFGENVLVSSLEFNYLPSSINESDKKEVTYLSGVVQKGHIQLPDDSYSTQELPELQFKYQQLKWNKKIKVVTDDNLIHAPIGISGNYQWIDLYGEGISGIFSEQGNSWFYKCNLGVNAEDATLEFSTAQQVAPRPSFAGMNDGTLTLQDLDANGKKQITVNSEYAKGYFELTRDESWMAFQPFEQVVNLDLQDPNIRMLDLTGDGRPEIVISEDNVFIWHESIGTKGYKKAYRSLKTYDESQGPSVIFNDQSQSIYLADMSGDGLTDIARIRNGEVCYWPNMGYGKFGAKIQMSNPPQFDHPDQYHPQYLQLADVSGTGATDILYLGQNQFKAYINDSGNALSDAEYIDPFFPLNANTKVSVTDLLGTGTSCIVWSSDLPEHAMSPMRYIDLMDSRKPHVMISYENGMGLKTSVKYKSSVHYYLDDKKSGKPWITKLPFPTQVISERVIQDLVADTTLTTKYSYHHGYYDHEEREFRGFGRVETRDTEDFNLITEDASTARQTYDETLRQDAVITKTWYHTGAFIERDIILNQFEKEYWYNLYNELFASTPLTINEARLPEADLADEVKALHGADYREALRACKGMTLRQEVFSLERDADSDISKAKLQATPYTVATHNCHIRLIQPKEDNRYGVFQVLESEALTMSYERNIEDPRIAHTINLEIDDLGHVLQSAAIVYPRNDLAATQFFDALKAEVTDFAEEVIDNNTQEQQRLQDGFERNLEAAEAAQTSQLIIITSTKYASHSSTKQDIDDDKMYRLRMPCEVVTAELTGTSYAGDIYLLEELKTQLTTASSNTFRAYTEDVTDSKLQLRIIEHVITQYLDNDLTPLQLERYASLGLVYESYQLAFTDDIVQDIYKKNGTDLKDANGTVVHSNYKSIASYANLYSDHRAWIKSGHVKYLNAGEQHPDAAERFYMAISYSDPLDKVTMVHYDPNFLYIKKSIDPVGNRSIVDQFSHRLMTPIRLIDSNANPVSVIINELGLVKAQVIEGNFRFQGSTDRVVEIMSADAIGRLKEYSESWETQEVQSIWHAADGNVVADSTSLQQACRNLLDSTTIRFIYDFKAWSEGRGVNSAISIARTQHHNEPGETDLMISFAYSDGGGNPILTKVQAEAGEAYYMLDGVKTSIDTGAHLRWVGNGRTILNNKGNPVKQYEPYFSSTFAFEDEEAIVAAGVTPILYYDPLDRVKKTLFPDGSLSRTTFDNWHQKIYDQNDTVLSSDWYARRTDLLHPEFITDEDEQSSASKAALHDNTPNWLVLDSLSRPILSMSDNGKDTNGKSRWYTTYIHQDIEGNTLLVQDARENLVMAYRYDMLGNRVFQDSMDAGRRWLLNNLIGNPILKWDDRDFLISYAYDDLYRPLISKVLGGDVSPPMDHIFEEIVYGEGRADEYTANFRGKPYKVFDTAGVVTSSLFDFKGNLIDSHREFLADYKNTPDWASNPTLESDQYVTSVIYDALNRPIHQLAPDHDDLTLRSKTSFGFNTSGLLDEVKVKQAGVSEKIFVKNIDYDAKGQRTKITYGDRANDDLATTTYTYDPFTYRLNSLITRKRNNHRLQELHYRYDPVGNITSIEDKAIPQQFFSNFKILPKGAYVYDPLYRLKEASGREHAALSSPPNTRDNWSDKSFRIAYDPGNPMAWRNYTQHYVYDPVGNILEMQHVAPGDGWTRKYYYADDSNRLSKTKVGSKTYHFPHHQEHGFITGLSHLSVMTWNFKDELQSAARRATAKHDHPDFYPEDNPPERTYYVYDSSGQRVRKITHAKGSNTTIKQQRYYLGNVERYIKSSGTNAGLERHSLHVMDDSNRIALVDTRTAGSDTYDTRTVRFQFSNHLGSACLEVDDLCRIISYEEYHPYGTTSYEVKNKAIQARAKRFKYNNKERDDETGLYYYGARYYLAWLGRWLKYDSIGIKDGINIYAYTNSNPISITDKDGRNGTRVHEEVRNFKSADEENFPFLGNNVQILDASNFSEDKKKFIEVYNKLISQNPNTYEGNVYEEILPEGQERSNYSAAATTTGNDVSSNRVRWLLQFFFVTTAINANKEDFNELVEDSRFGYEVHQAAFNMANDVDTIDNLPWYGLSLVDVPSTFKAVSGWFGFEGVPYLSSYRIGEHIVGNTIAWSNSPTGENSAEWFRQFIDIISWENDHPDIEPEDYQVIGSEIELAEAVEIDFDQEKMDYCDFFPNSIECIGLDLNVVNVDYYILQHGP